MFLNCVVLFVGETGLEPATSRSQTVRSSHLNYSPFNNLSDVLILHPDIRQVPPVGIEPTLCCQNEILSLARLPIPPPRQVISRYGDEEDYITLVDKIS